MTATAWLTGQAQHHPGRTTLIGFAPAIIILVQQTVVALQSSLFTGLILLALSLGCIAVMVAIAGLAELVHRLDRDKPDG